MRTIAITVLTMLAAGGAYGQEMEPRIYSNAPVGMNFLIAGYARSTGGLSVNPTAPLKNAHLTIDTPIIVYARVLDAWGKSAKFDAVLPAGRLSGSAEVNGSPLTREVSGLLDPLFRFSINLIGAPALRLPEFASYRQDLIVGASLQVSAPLGQYDPDRLVNLGANRWMFRPEVGASKAFGPLMGEGALAASFFTDNREYYVGRTLAQDPVYSVRGNLVYHFANGVWGSFNATYYAGGRTTLNGVRQDDLIQSSRIGATLTLPVDRHNSVKFSASKGVSVRTGTDFDIVGIFWQHRWGGGL